MFDPRQTREQLRKDVLEVTFTKKNGDERIMTCTLHPDILPIRDHNFEGDFGENDQDKDNIAVWDLEASAWRSLNCSKVVRIESDTQ